MLSDNRDIQSAIQSGESERVEFKKIFDKEAIETLVAFANHKGGMVLVGVEDSGRVAGVMCGPETIQGWVNQILNWLLWTTSRLLLFMSESSLSNPWRAGIGISNGLPTVITACPLQKSPICICNPCSFPGTLMWT